MREFMELVSKMRESQKAYFKTRHPNHLNASKTYEKAVDQHIEDYNNPKLGL